MIPSFKLDKIRAGPTSIRLAMTLEGVEILDENAIKVWEDVTSSHVATYFNLTLEGPSPSEMVETVVTSQSIEMPSSGSNMRRRGKLTTSLKTTIEYRQRFTDLAEEMLPSNIPGGDHIKLGLEVSLVTPFKEGKYLNHYAVALRYCDSCEAFIELKGVANIEVVPPTDAPTVTPTDTPTSSPVHVYLRLTMTLEDVGMLDKSYIKAWEDVTSSHVACIF